MSPNTSCKNVDTTASSEKPNKIKEGENSPPIAPNTLGAEADLAAEALKQIDAKKKKPA